MLKLGPVVRRHQNVRKLCAGIGRFPHHDSDFRPDIFSLIGNDARHDLPIPMQHLPGKKEAVSLNVNVLAGGCDRPVTALESDRAGNTYFADARSFQGVGCAPLLARASVMRKVGR